MPQVDAAAAEAVEAMKSQLLLVLIERLGGDITVTLDEIDNGTVGKSLALELMPHDEGFRFVVK